MATNRSSRQRATLERLTVQQLLEVFETAVQTGRVLIPYNDLAEAWEILFSKLFLFAGELVQSLESGDQMLTDGKKSVLREFVKTDCKNGGVFTLDVIKNGGKIDRAALIMIADMEDLVNLKVQESTALHQLASACDKAVRPTLIKRAGKRGLAERFDSRGYPAIFTILGLNDLSRDDLLALASVFTRDEMRGVKHKTRTGKNALEVYADVSKRLKGGQTRERNAFAINRAVKDTSLRGEHKNQSGTSRHLSGTDVMGDSGKEGEETRDSHGRYSDILTHPLDRFGMRRK